MKVLLIHLPYYRGQSWSISLGLGYIASVLLKAGLEVDVLDISLLVVKKQYSPDILYRKLKGGQYLFIGFGGVFFDFSYFQELSRKIKEICPDTPQIIGGQWASRIPELLISDTCVDAVVMGEGEEVILRVVDNICAGKPIGELRYVHTKNKPYIAELAAVQDIDKIPFPARHLFDMNYHRLEIWAPDPLRYYSIMVATRGCPNKCAFCNPLGGRVLRTRSPENIIQEMKELNEIYGIKYFRFNDEVFLGSNRKILAFCDALESSGLNITFSIWSWSENLSEETISRLKEVGCNRIQIGIESGSPQILKEMNKVQNLERVKAKVKFISDSGLVCGSGFLTGTPGETKETLRQTLNYIKELNSIRNFAVPLVSFIKLFKGAPLYDLAKEKKLIRDDLEFIIEADKNQMYKSVNLTRFNDSEYFDIVSNINRELKWDYYLKGHLIKRLLLIDEINYKSLFKNLSVKDIHAIVKKIGIILQHNIRSYIFKVPFVRKIVEFQLLGISKQSKENIFYENT